MAKTADTSWVTLFRRQLRSSVCVGDDGQKRPGWYVDEGRRGEMRLQYRRPGIDLATGRPNRAANIALPYRWLQDDTLEASKRIRQIFQGVEAGLSLEQAARKADTGNSNTTASSVDWRHQIELFRKQKQGDERISDRTWAETYVPRFKLMLEALAAADAPANGAALLQRVVETKPYGSRTREVTGNTMSAFLQFAVERGGLADRWAPPAAKAVATLVGPVRRSRNGAPINDTDLLELLAALPDTEQGRRWRFAMQLMAVTGCRATELAKLTVQGGQIWCSHRKRGGRGSTEERGLRILPVQLPLGGATDFAVIERLAAGEALPDHPAGDLGEQLNRLLRYWPAWVQLRQRYADRQQTLVPAYCLRYRWIKAAHSTAVPLPYLAKAAGHSPQTALKVYARFDDEAAATAAFEAAATQLSRPH